MCGIGNISTCILKYFSNCSANIRFCIATAFHPEDTYEDLVEGGPAVTIGYDFGGGNDADSNWSGYMNFLVKDIGGGLLGTALAYYLSKFGIEVTLLERSDLNREASGTNAGSFHFQILLV